MAGIQVAESTSSAKKGRKALSHLEIHPKLGGGHFVKHVYSNFEHVSKEVNFGKDEGQKMLHHIAKHTNVPNPRGEKEESETDDEIED